MNENDITIEEAADKSGLKVRDIKLINAFCEMRGLDVEYTQEMLDEAEGWLTMEYFDEEDDNPTLSELAEDFVDNGYLGEISEELKIYLDYAAIGVWLNITYNVCGRFIFSN